MLSILLYFDKAKARISTENKIIVIPIVIFNLNKPEDDDFITVLPAALVTVTFTLSISFDGTEQIIDLVLSLDRFVDDVVHVIVDILMGGVHTPSLGGLVVYRKNICFS